jgi:hypothetical protein
MMDLGVIVGDHDLDAIVLEFRQRAYAAAAYFSAENARMLREMSNPIPSMQYVI